MDQAIQYIVSLIANHPVWTGVIGILGVFVLNNRQLVLNIVTKFTDTFTSPSQEYVPSELTPENIFHLKWFGRTTALP